MKTLQARYFCPTDMHYRVAGHLGCIRYWRWTKRDGLWCHSWDGTSWKSDWRTLASFLKAVKEGRETRVVETTLFRWTKTVAP